MGAGEREIGVRKSGGCPCCGRVTGLTSGVDARGSMIRIGRVAIVRGMAGEASRGRTGIPTGMTSRASGSPMSTGEREIVVRKGGGCPSCSRVTRLASGVDARGSMIRIGRIVIVGGMATETGAGCPRIPADMT